MKNVITYLKALWSWGANSQSSDVSHDCRLTRGVLCFLGKLARRIYSFGCSQDILGAPQSLHSSPSGMTAKLQVNSFMRFAVFLTLIFTIGVGNAWGTVKSGWTRVTTTSEILDGGTFIIGYEATANTDVIIPLRSDGANATTSANGYLYSGTTAGSATTGTIDMSSIDNTSPYEVTIVASSVKNDVITIQLSTGNYIGTPSAKNTAKLYENANSTCTDYTVSMGDNDVVTLTNVAGAATSVKDGQNNYYFKYFRYNTGNGTQRFAHYRTGQADVVMYKKSSSCDNKVTISKGSETNGTFELNKTGEQNACDALSVTITPSPAEHFHVASVSATDPATTGTAGAAVNNGDGTWTITYSANSKGASTINVSFEAIPRYTITLRTGTGSVSGGGWSGSAGTYTQQQASEGASITLPTASPSSACMALGWTFAGWKEGGTQDETTSAPTLVAAETPVIPESDVTYYAVYKMTEGGGGGAAVNTVLYYEPFTGFTDNTTPTKPGSGATVYSSATITYANND